MFSEAVSEQIGHYVYRLIDPRDNSTFYVGKGQGNRVFSHVAEAGNDLERETRKLGRIRDIEAAGLQVEHIIHRHGLTEKEAFEVEAALIEAYSELSNIQAGRHSEDRGVMTVADVKVCYDPPGEYYGTCRSH